ncbi:hypothetical protein [Asaia astilbis]
MSGFSHVTRGLALCAASRFAQLTRDSAFWSDQKVIFRAGPLMPSDHFISPSLRETVCYVTIAPLSGSYNALAAPLGREWVETLKFPPVIAVDIRQAGVKICVSSPRLAPGIVALLWRRDDGGCATARHVVREQEAAASIAQNLAVQLKAAWVEGDVLSVKEGSLEVATGGYGRSSRLKGRQSQIFRISVWSTDSTMRAAVGDVLVSRLLPQDWLALPDGTMAQVIFEGDADQDSMQTRNLFRRDVDLKIVFDRFETVWTPQMVAGGGWAQLRDEVVSFGAIPDQLSAEIPRDALEALASSQETPTAYRGWHTDRDGTVRAGPEPV